MSAAKAYYLYIFQMIVLRSQYTAAQHTGMEVVYYIDTRLAQFHIRQIGQRIRSQHRHAHAYQQFGKLVVYQRIVVIRPAGQHHGKAVVFLNAFKYQLACSLKFRIIILLRACSHLNSAGRYRRFDIIGLLHVIAELLFPVFIGIPVEVGRIKFNAVFLIRVVRILYNDGITLYQCAA